MMQLAARLGSVEVGSLQDINVYMFIPQSTTIRVPLQAYLAATTTAATGKTIAITISKNGAAYANPSAGATNATEIASGSYYVDLSTTDINTLGPLFVRGTSATIDDIVAIYQVVSASVGPWSNLDAAVTTRMAAYTQPTGFLAATFPSGTIANTTNITAGALTSVGTLTTYTGNTLQTGDAYARVGASGVGLTALGDIRIANLDATISSRATPAQVNAEADQALLDYDGPTNTELAARTLTAATYATAADLTSVLNIANKLDTALVLDGAVYQYTANALELAPGSGSAPTAAQIATEIFTDLLSGSDFSTASSFGKLVKDNLDATISSRATPSQVNTEVDTALSDYDAPTNTEMIARTLTSATYATAANLANVAASTDNLPPDPAGLADLASAHGAGAWTTATGFSTLDAAGVRTAVGLATANLDTQLAGLDSLTAPEVAAAVLNATSTSYQLVGSVGAKIASAAAAGDPLTSTVPGVYAQGTAGYVIGTFATGRITVSPPLMTLDGGTMYIGIGYSYKEDHNNAFLFSSALWPDLVGGSVTLVLRSYLNAPSLPTGPVEVSIPGTVLTATAISFDIGSEITETLTKSERKFEIQALLLDGHLVLLGTGVAVIS